MMVSRTAQQHFTAWLAILAVLLLFMMPVVSTSLVEAHQKKMPDAYTDVAARTHLHQHNTPLPEAAVAKEDPQAADIHRPMSAEGLACGYCDLLVHVPLILWLFLPFIWQITLIARVQPVVTISAPARRHPYGFPHPRAPPPSLSGTSYAV